MACFHPLQGYRSRTVDPKTGRRGVVFNKNHGFSDLPLEIPCGQCIGCRLERSRQWALRCHHEAQLHDQNCFITLTYDDDHLNASRSLVVRDYQLFMKRLRKKYSPKIIRFYHCGEYGDENRRPHYHACLFNHDFDDKVLWKKHNDNDLFISAQLSELWPLGFCSLTALTFQSAAYVARYVLKKRTGPSASEHYTWIDLDGVVHDLIPEYTTMSRRPGLGHGWLSKFKSDIYPGDFVVLKGVKMRPPKYYDKIIEAEDPKQWQRLQGQRAIRARLQADNNTPARLRVREKVQQARARLLVRNLGKDA